MVFFMDELEQLTARDFKFRVKKAGMTMRAFLQRANLSPATMTMWSKGGDLKLRTAQHLLRVIKEVESER